MPIVTPHESQAGIATGNAGQIAPYRSASAFITPGQAAGPNGLNALARGMDRLGDAVFRMGLDRLKMQNATDLLADKVAYEDALRQFDSDYRQTHQGVSARDAEEAYAAFHQAQYDKLQKKWGGNPWLMEGVDRMAEGIRLPSMQRAVNYRDGEEEAYKKSVLQSSQAQTFAVFGDLSVPWEEKQRALEQEEDNLRLFAGQQPVMVDGKTQWQGGREVTAEAMALRQKLLAEHFNALVQSGNLDGAQALLGGGAGAASLLPASARFRFQASLDAARKRQEAEFRQQQEEADLGMAQRLVQETRGIGVADRQRILYDRLAEIPDQGRRNKVAAWCRNELAFEAEQRKAHDLETAMKLCEEGRKLNETPTQFQMRVNAAKASPEAKNQAKAMFNGKIEENELNMRALDELRLKIDKAERKGEPMSKDAVYTFAYDRRMTNAQTKAALAYLEDGGNLGTLKQSDVNAAYRALHPADNMQDKDIPVWLYAAVQKGLEPGKPVNGRELQRLIARLEISGTVPGRLFGRNSITRGEALVQGKDAVFEEGPDTEALADEDA